MKIQSNTKGKLQKIMEGKVFDSSYTFLTELFQNSFRAKAKNVYIYVLENKFIMQDDGVGMKNPKSLLTFDYSEWDSTNEGFGIGFWSVLGVPELKTVEITSRTFNIFMDIEKAIDDLEVDVNTLQEPFPGFKVLLVSDYFNENKSELIDKINKAGMYMPYNIFVNDKQIEQKSLLTRTESEFKKEFNTRLFNANLGVSDGRDCIEIYYENRLVKEFYDVPYITGVLLLKNNAVTLKEPDRTSIVYDSKYYAFKDKIFECVKTLYKDFIKDLFECNDMRYIDNTLDNYDRAIAYYLDVKDYQKYLLCDEKDLELSIESKIKKEVERNNPENVINILNGVSGNWILLDEKPLIQGKIENFSIDEDSIKVRNILFIGDKIFKKISDDSQEEDEKEVAVDIIEKKNEEAIKSEVSIKSEDDIFDISDSFIYKDNQDDIKTHTIKTSTKKLQGNNLLDLIKKSKAVMWVESNSTDYYEEQISLAESYKIKVIKSKNKLFERFFTEKSIPHVSTIESVSSIERKITEINPKTFKEEQFLLLLEPIRKKYKLPENIFKIGNIDIEYIYEYDGKRIVTKKLKNKIGQINVYGVNYNGGIIFDRRALDLKRFNLSITKDEYVLGKHELRCLLCNIETVAHELAHRLYATKDDTVIHYKMTERLQDEITAFLIKNIK